MLHFFARRMKEAREDERGFTLIELLVVVIIIGILAAIAIPAFLNQRQRGQDAAAKSLVRSGASQMASCETAANPPSYAGCTVATMATIDPNTAWVAAPTVANAANNQVQIDNLGATTYTLASTSQSGATFTLAFNNGAVTRTATGGGAAATW